ncbi:MAG: hypothetical protein Q4G69_07240, partial [Planctomycetia bacterium]|nr:hypothetical protein [Planctomycetia bacterium]
MKKATNGSGPSATARQRVLGAAPRRQPAGFGYNTENRLLVFGRKNILLHPVGMAENRRPEGAMPSSPGQSTNMKCLCGTPGQR